MASSCTGASHPSLLASWRCPWGVAFMVGAEALSAMVTREGTGVFGALPCLTPFFPGDSPAGLHSQGLGGHQCSWVFTS